MPTHPNLDVRGEIVQLLADFLLQCGAAFLVCVEVDITGRNESLLSREGVNDLGGKLCTGISHGERRRSSTIFRFNDLVTTKLDACREGLQLFGGEGSRKWVGRLGKEGYDLR